ncbi:hypothetical protein Pfo_005626 [Paulownia fortunei]|nr:hypothetical protein Pfo_005626 [Paulownia fortunei]
MKLQVIVCFIFLFVAAPLHGTAARLSMARRNLEVKRHLRRLNKPALKSIKSPDGDIIDCVHISHQPAFDHPSLKNHTVQMRPSYHPEGLFSESKKVAKNNEVRPKPITQMWHMNGRCPEGTIPIRRTKKEDVLRASSVSRYGKKKHKSIPIPRSAAPEPDLINQNGHQHAIAYVEGDKYYGAKATINVWDPKIQHPNEFSLSQLWILGGSFASDLNSIEAGWQVSPDLYGDNNTRFFTYWTSDAYQATGCYNMLCSGFIQSTMKYQWGPASTPSLAITILNMISVYLSGRTLKKETGGCNLGMTMYWDTGQPFYFPTYQTVLHWLNGVEKW